MRASIVRMTSHGIGRAIVPEVRARLAPMGLPKDGRERRYRAMNRHRLLRHARVAVLVVPGLAVFNIVVLLAVGGHAPVATIIVRGTMAAIAICAYFFLRRAGRRHPDQVVMLVATAATIASAGVGLAEPGLAVFAAGYLMLTPLAIALLIPWRPVIHLIWLAAHSSVALPAIMLMGGLSDTDRLGLLMISISMIGVSLIGRLLANHEDRRSFGLRRELVASRGQLAGSNRALARSLRQDLLTGARNRLRLVEDLAAVRSTLGRTTTSWGLLALDLDRFKGINDLYGHAAGDAVLTSVVDAMQATLRPVDGVYRTGGEEFIVLLPDLDEAEVLAVAQRLRRAVRALAISNQGNPPHGVVTISVGVTVLHAGDLEYEDDRWLARADNAVYAAKSAGRDRVEMSSRLPPRPFGQLAVHARRADEAAATLPAGSPGRAAAPRLLMATRHRRG